MIKFLQKRLSVIYLASLFLLPSCATNLVTGKNEVAFVPVASEIQLGEENYGPMQQAQGGRYLAHPEISEYVNKVGRKLAAVSDRPDLPYEFIVLNNSIPNAWTLPGGKIAINRGLLTELNDEAELAAVLSHEIVHAAARHGAQSIEKGVFLQAGLAGVGAAVSGHQYEDMILGTAAVGANLISLKYSRNAELEADHYGMKYMSKAGYDLNAAVRLQETFNRLSDEAKPGWIEGLFATHPPTQERIAANKETFQEFISSGYNGKEDYQNAMEPLFRTKDAYANFEKGQQALDQGNASLAMELAQKALEKEPREALFHCLLGRAQFNKGDLPGALKSLSAAIDLNNEYYDFFLQRGIIKQSQGAFTDARQDLEKSLSFMPTVDAHYALGQIELKEGRREKAIEHFTEASKSQSEKGKLAQTELEKLSSE